MSEIETYEVNENKKPKFGLINFVLAGVNVDLFIILAVVLFSPEQKAYIVIGKYGIFTILFGMWILVLGLVIARKMKQSKAKGNNNGKPKN